MEYPPCACGHARYRERAYSAPAKNFSVLTCRECGLSRTWPVPVMQNEAADFYGEQLDFNDRLERLPVFQEFARKLVRKAPLRKGRWIDVGCNIGVVVSEALRAGFDASGCDLSSAAIAAGQNALKLQGRLRQGNLAEQCLPDASCDVISYAHCLEHIEGLTAELGEVRRVLKPGAYLLVEVPDYLSIWRKMQQGRWYPFSPYQHIWQFDHASLPAWLERSGFAIEQVCRSEDMLHTINLTPKGLANSAIWLLARILRSGDNLTVVARKI